MTKNRKWVAAAILLTMVFLLGVGGALAVGETTGTNVACATATAPGTTVSGFVAHGVSVPDVVVPDSVASNCETITYTIPTVTQTGPTTTVTSTVTSSSTTSTTSTTVPTTSTTVPTTSTTVPTTTTVPTPPGTQPNGPPGTWTLTFDDEFNGTSLDRSKWDPCWFFPTCGSMNNVSTPTSNVSVGNGVATLTLSDSSHGALINTNPHNGATTGYEFQYGVVEARILFPSNGPQCLNWPAWWTDGQSWPGNGEYDIAEVLGGNVTVNYHSSSLNGQHFGPTDGLYCGGYHIFTMDREAGHATVYYDGTQVASFPTADGGAMQYLILNIGNGGVHVYPSQMKVDYVRAWR